MKRYLFHVEAARQYFFHIFCIGRYTGTLDVKFFFATFQEEFIYFKILPTPPPGYLVVAPLPFPR